MVVILRQHENWCRLLSSVAKSTSDSRADRARQVNQLGPLPIHPTNCGCERVSRGEVSWLGESDHPWTGCNLSEDALTRCPVFGSRGNRQPRQILFRIQILSKSRGVRDDQSMTTQQHQLVQNQVRSTCHISIVLRFWVSNMKLSHCYGILK